MSLNRTAEPAVEPISLAEARAQCRIDGTAEDDLLAIYIDTARRACEKLLSSALITQDWTQTLDAFPSTGDIKLLKPPVQSILSVTYVDTAGATQTLASDAYVLDGVGDDDEAAKTYWLLPADGTTWPATDDVINAVTISMRCGFGDEGADVPGPLRAWMLLNIGLLYAQREAVDATGKSVAVPGRFVDGLLDHWRQYGL